MIRKCLCQHQDQDRRYGSKMRVMNKCDDGYRCTACGQLDRPVARTKKVEPKEDKKGKKGK